MKATFSVLVSGLSGSSGDVVASKTHGIPYFRRRTTPKYTNTAPQVIVRNNLARCPGLWRGLPANLVTLINAAVLGTVLSGYNAVAKAIMKSLAPDPVTHLRTHCINFLDSIGSTPNANLVTAGGSSTNDIQIQWTTGAATAGNYVVPWVCAAPVELDANTLADGIIFGAPVALATGTATITGLTANLYYDAGIFVIDKATVAAATKVSDSESVTDAVQAGACGLCRGQIGP